MIRIRRYLSILIYSIAMLGIFYLMVRDRTIEERIDRIESRVEELGQTRVVPAE